MTCGLAAGTFEDGRRGWRDGGEVHDGGVVAIVARGHVTVDDCHGAGHNEKSVPDFCLTRTGIRPLKADCSNPFSVVVRCFRL
jgi:hypothetical protein